MSEDVQSDADKQMRFDVMESIDESDKKQEEIEARDGYPIPIPEVKLNVHTLLNSVLHTKNTTKCGFLKEEELGLPNNPVRTYKELALISSKICNNPLMQSYFEEECENTLATSLSREGKFINLAVMTKKVIEDTTKERKPNSGWFRKKEPEERME